MPQNNPFIKNTKETAKISNSEKAKTPHSSYRNQHPGSNEVSNGIITDLTDDINPSVTKDLGIKKEINNSRLTKNAELPKTILNSLSENPPEYEVLHNKDLIYVNSYYRTRADNNSYNNYSTTGNYNPYTGQTGNINPLNNYNNNKIMVKNKQVIKNAPRNTNLNSMF